MKAYRGVDPLDFLAETGKRILYIYMYKYMKNEIISNHITSYQVTAPNIPSPSRKKYSLAMLTSPRYHQPGPRQSGQFGLCMFSA
jgi:hypothetical protein